MRDYDNAVREIAKMGGQIYFTIISIDLNMVCVQTYYSWRNMFLSAIIIMSACPIIMEHGEGCGG